MAEDVPLEEWSRVVPYVYHEKGRYKGLPRYTPIGKPSYERGTGRLVGRIHPYPNLYDKWGFPHRYGPKFGPAPNANANAPPFMENEPPPPFHSPIPQRSYECLEPGCNYHGRTRSALVAHKHRYHSRGGRRLTKRARRTRRQRH